MKRIVTLLLAAGLVFGAFSGAQAADIKAKGNWTFELGWLDNVGFKSSKHNGAGEDDFKAAQRLRTQIDVVASEALSGTVYFEIGTSQWGAEDAGLGADGKVVKVKRSYIDWSVPQTDLKIRMGIQDMTLPGAMGSAILSEEAAGITASYAFNDMFALTALWARPFNTGDADETAIKNTFDEMDLFGLLAPITYDGFKVTPFVIAGSLGKDVAADTVPNKFNSGVQAGLSTLNKGATAGLDNTASLFWAGAAFEMSRFDPFSLKLDLNYGKKGAEDEDADRSGWLVDGIASYKLGMVTPGLFFWYGSGEDSDRSNGSERMPFIAPVWGNSTFAYGNPGSALSYDAQFASNGVGTWALGLQLADISFIENLSHVVRVAYITGTNNKDAIMEAGPNFAGNLMTSKDHLWEVNFDTTYKIYDNLTAGFEFGYMKLNLSDEVWGNQDLDDAWKGMFTLTYAF